MGRRRAGQWGIWAVFNNPPLMAHPLSTLFGRLVRRRRELLGLTQEELGHRSAVSRNYIGMVERGETNPTLIVLQSLAGAMGTTMVDLVQELEVLISATSNPSTN